MKIKLMIAVLGLVGLLNVNGQTNVVIVETNKVEESGFSTEITLGGFGSNVDRENETGFKKLPDLWVGIVQETYWGSSFSAASDVNLNWSTQLYKELYVNTGYAVGVEYGDSTNFRHGPEITLQYYVGENAFLYSGASYKISKDYKGIFYSWGIGLVF